MSSCWFLISLLLVLLAHSLALAPTESSSDSINDVPGKQGSYSAEQREPENSCSKSHCPPINIQIYGHGDPSSTTPTDKILNQTGTILDILKSPESRYIPRPAPSGDHSSSPGADKPINLTGTILAILQSQDSRYTPRQALSDDRSDTAATGELLNMTGTILDILQSQESLCTPRPAPNFDPSNTASTDKILNQTGTILDILQTQAARNILIPSLNNVSGNPRDCAEIQASGQNTSGIYPVYPDGDGDPFFVWCDMETDGGGWTVFQRRQDGSVDFFIEWAAYKYGFGSVSSEHWLGNDNIHRLTIHKVNELRVDLEDFEGQTRYARYSTFFMLDEDAKYTMTTGDYSGDAEDSLSYHSGYQFSTKDSDNDGSTAYNCATRYHGAWWHNSCLHVNLNGLYLDGTHTQAYKGVTWYGWLGHSYSLKKTEMKIRPVYTGI